MSCGGRKKKVQSIIIPEGYIQPNETAIVEIPKSLQKAPVLYAHPRKPNAMAANKSAPNQMGPIDTSTPIKPNFNKTAPARYGGAPCSPTGETCNASNRTFGNGTYSGPPSPSTGQFSRYGPPVQSTFNQSPGMPSNLTYRQPNLAQPEQNFNQTYQRVPKVIQNTTITKTGPKTVIQSKRITETDTESIISEEITETYEEEEEADFPHPNEEAKMRLQESAKQCYCGSPASHDDKSQVSGGRGRYPGMTGPRSPNFGQTFDNNFTYTTIYDDSDDQYVSSSGEMDTSLLGRVVGGDIPRNIEYPTNYKFKQYDSGGRTIPSQGPQMEDNNDDSCGCRNSRNSIESRRTSPTPGTNRSYTVSTNAPEGVRPTKYQVSREIPSNFGENMSSFNPPLTSSRNNQTYSQTPAVGQCAARCPNFGQTYDNNFTYTTIYDSDDQFVSSSGEMDTSLLGRVVGGDIPRNIVYPTNYKFKQYYSDGRTIPSGVDNEGPPNSPNKSSSPTNKKITFKPEEVCPCPPEIKQGNLPKQFDLSETSTKSSVAAQLVATNDDDCICETDQKNATYLVAGTTNQTQIINSNTADLEKIEQAEKEQLDIELKKWQEARRRLLWKTFEDLPNKKTEPEPDKTY